MSSKTTFHQRWLTIILLLLLGGDIGVHVIAGLYAAPESDGAALSAPKEPGQHSHEDHPGCGPPEHGGVVGHHHHFPAILRPVHLPIALAGRLQRSREPGATTPHVLLVARSVRAPPSD